MAGRRQVVWCHSHTCSYTKDVLKRKLQGKTLDPLILTGYDNKCDLQTDHLGTKISDDLPERHGRKKCTRDLNLTTMSAHADKDLDLSNAGRGVWLVKVPKYIANKWEKAPGNIEVGKLKIVKTAGQKSQVSLTLPESVLCLKQPGEENIPREHRLDVSQVTRQTIGVFSHVQPSSNSDSVVPESEKLSLEGRIVQKLECRPYADNCYMKLKLESIRRASVPTRQVQQLERIVNTFKPVSDHKHNIEYVEKKKSEGKKARDDKDAVLEMLFSAFEKHQYYNIKDLVMVTRQPVVYLKEILKDVCNYNLKNPHKNMWELKPEYRHYKESEQPKPEPTPE